MRMNQSFVHRRKRSTVSSALVWTYWRSGCFWSSNLKSSPSPYEFASCTRDGVINQSVAEPGLCGEISASASAGVGRRSALRGSRLPSTARKNFTRSDLLGRCVLGIGRFLPSRMVAKFQFRDSSQLAPGGLVAAVPGAIVTLRAGEIQFRRTHPITRGTRPLHITAVPGGAVFWGEYFDNPAREEVHIYVSSDDGATWNVAYVFPKHTIRHVHNIVYDRWGDCLWVLTGDYGDECRILRASCDFRQVEVVVRGNQQARAVGLIPMED